MDRTLIVQTYLSSIVQVYLSSIVQVCLSSIVQRYVAIVALEQVVNCGCKTPAQIVQQL